MQGVKFARPDTSQFFTTLRKNVNRYFQENNLSKNGDHRMVIKTICMYTLYFGPYLLIMLGGFSVWVMAGLCLVMGLGQAGIGFSVAHDAAHGAYSGNKFWNKILSYSFNIIGGSSFTWNIQHNILHHTYTNIYELDEDIDDKPFLRLSPHGKLNSHHKYQHLYAPFLYTLATVSWMAKKDFAQMAHYNRSGLTEKSGHYPQRELITMLVSKSIYFLYMLVLPILFLTIAWWQILLGFLLMQMVSGFMLTIVFQLAHVVEGPTHHKPVMNGTMENTWAIHQLMTTANFARNNKILSWFVGGLNYQIEHHLFPHICHVHYKNISKIVQKTAKEFNLPYFDQPTFRAAIGSHLRVLKAFGNATN